MSGVLLVDPGGCWGVERERDKQGDGGESEEECSLYLHELQVHIIDNCIILVINKHCL